MFQFARTPRVRMFIEAEKKKLTRVPNPQPPLPFATSGPLGNGVFEIPVPGWLSLPLVYEKLSYRYLLC